MPRYPFGIVLCHSSFKIGGLICEPIGMETYGLSEKINICAKCFNFVFLMTADFADSRDLPEVIWCDYCELFFGFSDDRDYGFTFCLLKRGNSVTQS